MFKCTLRSASALALFLALAATPVKALTIVNTFDTTLTSDPSVAQIEATINAASSTISSLYSNNVTVNITYQLVTTGLGGSSQGLYGVDYASYRAALTADAAAHPTDTTLATAVAHLQSGSSASAASGGVTSMALTGSLFNVLAQYGGANPVWNPPVSPAGGAISLNSSLISWGNGPVTGGLYSGTSVVEHEIDEILGGGGPGSALGQPYSGSFLGSLDAYRYRAPGVQSFDTADPSAYFSIDGGVTNIVGFNQTGSGDYGDFINTCHIQNAFGCPDTPAETFRGSVQDTMLQALGYDSVAAPAPAPGAGLACLAAVLFAGAARKRSKPPRA